MTAGAADAADAPAASAAAGEGARMPVPQPRCTHLLYLHGFRSSPRSAKAQTVAAWVARHRPDVTWHCPQLPPSPAEAMRGVLDRVSGWPRESTAVIGSSLGGFYATFVAERIAPGCRAALLNPAVHPARDLEKYIGEQTAWHGDDRFHFRAEFIDELRALECADLTRRGRYLAVIAKGDEVLDWREMAARYAGCRVRLIEGGDHALSDFAEAHLPEVVRFLGLG